MAEHPHEDRWKELMVKAQAGNAGAYADLLRELRPFIVSFCRKRLGSLMDVEDTVQDALMGIHKVRHTYDPSRPFTPWMYALVRYKLIDGLRKKIRITSNELANDEIVERQTAPSNQGQSDGPDDVLKGALDSLNSDQREILDLVKFKGMSMKEAANKLSITESAAKVRVHRAVTHLRKQFERRVRGD